MWIEKKKKASFSLIKWRTCLCVGCVNRQNILFLHHEAVLVSKDSVTYYTAKVIRLPLLFFKSMATYQILYPWVIEWRSVSVTNALFYVPVRIQTCLFH